MSAKRTPAAAPPVLRSSGIGSSDIPAIAGLSRFKTPFDVWLEKTGRAPDELESEGFGRDPKFWGKALERRITEVYAKREKRSLIYLFDEPRRHPSDAWHIGSPDAHDAEVVVDAKNVGLSQAYAFGDDGTDEIPDEYIAQGAWLTNLLDLPRFDLAALIGGQELRIYHFERNRTLEDALKEIGFRFWTDHVQADTPPPVQDSETARGYFRKRFGREKVEPREATPDEVALVVELANVQPRLKALAKREADLKLALKLSIGDAAAIKAEEFEVTSKANKDSTVTDWKAAFLELRNELALFAPALHGDESRKAEVALIEGLGDLVQNHTKTEPGARPLKPKFFGALKQLTGDTE